MRENTLKTENRYLENSRNSVHLRTPGFSQTSTDFTFPTLPPKLLVFGPAVRLKIITVYTIQYSVYGVRTGHRLTLKGKGSNSIL